MSRTPDNPSVQAGAALDVPLHTLAALLGGAPARDLLPTNGPGEAIAARLDAPRAFLTPGVRAPQPSPRAAEQLALEVLTLKVRALAALCRLLQQHDDRRTLHADDLTATLRAAAGSLTPARWDVQLELCADTPTSGPELRRGLGLAFAQVLFCNDRRTAEQCEAAAEQTAQQLAQALGVTPGTAATTARAVFARSELGQLGTTLFPAALRERLAPRPASRAIWLDLGTLVMQLFSDDASFAVAAPVPANVAERLEAIGRRLEVAAFGEAARRDELAELIRATAARRAGGR